jgi:hypothetical protein
VIALTFAAALWGGLWWRLRGGAFTALTGFDPGTGGMRAIAAAALVLPLALFDWHLAGLVPVLWLGWSCAGWGAFQGMGASPVDRSNPVAGVVAFLGARSPLANCLAGMAVEGVALMTWLALFLPTPAFFFVAAAGLAFAPLYFGAQRSPWLPDCGRFARAGSEWAEVLVGAWVALVTAGACCLH